MRAGMRREDVSRRRQSKSYDRRFRNGARSRQAVPQLRRLLGVLRQRRRVCVFDAMHGRQPMRIGLCMPPRRPLRARGVCHGLANPRRQSRDFVPDCFGVRLRFFDRLGRRHSERDAHIMPRRAQTCLCQSRRVPRQNNRQAQKLDAVQRFDRERRRRVVQSIGLLSRNDFNRIVRAGRIGKSRLRQLPDADCVSVGRRARCIVAHRHERLFFQIRRRRRHRFVGYAFGRFDGRRIRKIAF